MRTGEINYSSPTMYIYGYLGEDGFEGEVEVRFECNTWISASGEFARVDEVGGVEIDFEFYLND